MDRNLEDFWGYTSKTDKSLFENSRTAKIDELLSLITQDCSYVKEIETIGHIKIFDIERTKDTDFLRYHPLVKKVFTIYDLRETLRSLSASILLLPYTAVVDRGALSEICEHYRCIKTVFYEYDCRDI